MARVIRYPACLPPCLPAQSEEENVREAAGAGRAGDELEAFQDRVNALVQRGAALQTRINALREETGLLVRACLVGEGSKAKANANAKARSGEKG